MQKTYITSRGFLLPKSLTEFGDRCWFNLWKNQQWPYRELEIGDILYWYEKPSKSIAFKASIVDVHKFTYASKNEAQAQLESRFGNLDASEPYYVKAPSKGYGLAYKVIPLFQTEAPKPSNIKIPQLGWLHADEKIRREWLAKADALEDDMTLDEVAPKGQLLERLHQLNSSMVNRPPRLISSVVERTIRRDTELIRTLKEVCEFRCQYPGCNLQISKKDGGFYIEVAHVRPFKKGGPSVLGNLLVLCPNHHKEFDFGDLLIYEQTPDLIRGLLNGKKFLIRLPKVA